MELHFNATGERRKALVQAISEITGNYNLHDNNCHIATTAISQQSICYIPVNNGKVYSFFPPVNSEINLSQNVSFLTSTSTPFVSSGFSIPSHFNTN